MHLEKVLKVEASIQDSLNLRDQNLDS